MKCNLRVLVALIAPIACAHSTDPTPAATGGAFSSAGGTLANGATSGQANQGGQAATGGASTSQGASGTAAGGQGAAGALAGGASAGGVSGAATGGAPGAAGAATTGCPRACGPSYDQFFDNKKVATLRVTTSSTLPAYSSAVHCAPFTWLKSQIVYESPDGVGNVTLDNVGFRWRGSRPQPLQGFKLDVQVLDTPGPGGKRRFADLNRLNLLSVEGDDSHMVQCLAYKMMRDFGLPAPRCNHLKVYLNGTLYGVMESVEQINKGYTRRHFGTKQGSLYGASPSMNDCTTGGFKDSQALLVYSSDSFSSYTTQYQLTHATTAEAEQNLIPMLKCGDTSATPDDATFRTCIQEWIDVSEWLKQIAAESILPTLESMIGYYRNYYLHFEQNAAAPHAGRFGVWSWDVDNAFQNQRCNTSTCDVFTAVSSSYGTKPRAKLVTRLTTVFRAEYCAAMNDFLTAFTASQVDDMASVLTQAFASEPSVSASAWQTAVDNLKTHIGNRTTAVRAQIANACK